VIPVTRASRVTSPVLITMAREPYPGRTAFLYNGQAFTSARPADLLGRLMGSWPSVA